MTMTIEIGKSRTIGLTEEQLATLRGHDAVANKVWHRGLKEMLSDANAGVVRKDFNSDAEYQDAAYAASMKLLDALLAGVVRASSATRAPQDPVGAEAMRLARVFVNGKARGWEKDKSDALTVIASAAAKLGLPNTNVDERKAVIAAWIVAYAAKPETRAEAEDNVAANRARAAAAKDDTGL